MGGGAPLRAGEGPLPGEEPGRGKLPADVGLDGVDLYAEKDGAVTVVDFKTDYVTEDTVAEKAAHYRPQPASLSCSLTTNSQVRCAYKPSLHHYLENYKGKIVILGKELGKSFVSETVAGAAQDYYVFRMPVGGLTLKIPTASGESFGLRGVWDLKRIQQLLKDLSGLEVERFTGSWNQRYRENMQRLKSGDLYEVARSEAFKAIRVWAKTGTPSRGWRSLFSPPMRLEDPAAATITLHVGCSACPLL